MRGARKLPVRVWLGVSELNAWAEHRSGGDRLRDGGEMSRLRRRERSAERKDASLTGWKKGRSLKLGRTTIDDRDRMYWRRRTLARWLQDETHHVIRRVEASRRANK